MIIAKQDIEEKQRMLGKGRKVPKRYTTATTNPVILMAHYVTKGIKGVARGGWFGSGASRLMSGLDTFSRYVCCTFLRIRQAYGTRTFLKDESWF